MLCYACPWVIGGKAFAAASLRIRLLMSIHIDGGGAPQDGLFLFTNLVAHGFDKVYLHMTLKVPPAGLSTYVLSPNH